MAEHWYWCVDCKTLTVSRRRDACAGIGDAAIRAKYTLWRQGGSGLAAGVESRLPTGNEEDLLGAGKLTIKPRVITSFETARISVNGDIGYVFGGVSNELAYNGALTVTAVPRLTVIAEILGRRLDSFGRLIETTERHPRLAGVDTIRLTAVQAATHRIVAVVGFKWNVSGTWLVAANVLRPVTSAGLNAPEAPKQITQNSRGTHTNTALQAPSDG